MMLTTVVVLMAVTSIAGFASISKPNPELTCKTLFGQLDQNGDSLISEEEFYTALGLVLEGLKDMDQALTWFTILDKDKSGEVDPKEFAIRVCNGEAIKDNYGIDSYGEELGSGGGYYGKTSCSDCTAFKDDYGCPKHCSDDYKKPDYPDQAKPCTCDPGYTCGRPCHSFCNLCCHCCNQGCPGT